MQVLFEELPEKLKERRTSLQSTPSVSRKRPQPITDPAVFPGNLPMPRSVPSSARDSTFPSHRARSIPSDQLNKHSKKNSLPNSPATSVSSFSVGQPMKNNSFVNQSNTPAVGPFDWSVPQMQQGNFPDLKNVMFPSDDPFAYGNQPISTLEDNQFGGLQDISPDAFSNTNGNQFPSPDVSQTNLPPPQFNMTGFDTFNGLGHMNQQQRQQQQHIPNNLSNTSLVDSPTANGQTPMFNMSGSFVNEPDTMQHSNQQHGQDADDYWSSAPNKGQFRTGFTPGAPPVNLDELFGSGNGWGPMNMGMDFSMGIGDTTNSGNLGGPWPGANNSNNNNNWQ